MHRPHLQQLQQAFKNVLEQPHVDVDLALFDIKPARPSIEERLGVYQYAFFARIEESLADDFSMVKDVVGEAMFTELVKQYLARYPSVYASLGEVSENFPRFLSTSFVLNQYPFIGDLACFEWLQMLAQLAKNVSTNDFAKLAEFDAEELKNVMLQVHPSVHFFRSDWAVHACEKDRPALSEKSCYIIYRNNDEIFHQCITEADWKMFHAIMQKHSLADLPELYLACFGAEKDLSSWFSHWVSERVIVDFIDKVTSAKAGV